MQTTWQNVKFAEKVRLSDIMLVILSEGRIGVLKPISEKSGLLRTEQLEGSIYVLDVFAQTKWKEQSNIMHMIQQ